MNDTDEQLVSDARDGDEAAFGELVRRYERRLFALAYGMLNSSEDARECVQETFINAFRNLKNFRGDAQVATWLHRIAINACISRARYNKSRPQTELDKNDDGAARIESNNESPFARAQRLEQAASVRRAVASLPLELRQVVVMKEFEDLTFQEISDTLDVPLSTIKSRLYTGLKQLRQKLTHHAPPVVENKPDSRAAQSTVYPNITKAVTS